MVANWIASGNMANDLNDLHSSEVALGSGNRKQSSTISVSGDVAVSSLGGNRVGSVQESIGGWLCQASACSGRHCWPSSICESAWPCTTYGPWESSRIPSYLVSQMVG
jgi:hypothetical protein